MWKTSRCRLVIGESNVDVTTCECDHLTVFAALVDPYGLAVSPRDCTEQMNFAFGCYDRGQNPGETLCAPNNFTRTFIHQQLSPHPLPLISVLSRLNKRLLPPLKQHWVSGGGSGGLLLSCRGFFLQGRWKSMRTIYIFLNWFCLKIVAIWHNYGF